MDESRICPWNIGKDRLSSVGVSICTKTFAKQMAKKTNQIKGILRDASSSSANDKKFSKTMAKFGEVVWSNPFLFKQIVNRGIMCGLKANVEITGQRISKATKSLSIGDTTQCDLSY